MAGYSGTALSKKLAIKPGSRLALLGAPAHYLQLLAPMPADVTRTGRVSVQTDVIHLFATSRRVLETGLSRCRKRMRDDAALWVSWPKKASKVPTDLTEDVIREVVLPLGLVDVKVCAVDDIWSALKLVIRKSNRSQ